MVLNKQTKANQIYFRQQARTLVKFHFPSRKLKIQPLSGGITNFVFGVTAGKEQLVIRISNVPESINGFLKEQWAVNKAREKKIPVPEILEVGNSIIPYPYMIVEKIAGQSSIGHPERKNILKEMGRLTAIIHDIPTTGYGALFNWTENVLDKKNTWKAFLSDELAVKQRIGFLKKTKMLTVPAATALHKVVEEMRKMKASPHLHHGDMRLKNIMADKKGKINAVLDWENSISAIGPWWDLSISLHDLPMDGQQSFLDGYGITNRKLIPGSSFIKAFNILNYAPVIEKLLVENKNEELSHYKARLRGALDLFSL